MILKLHKALFGADEIWKPAKLSGFEVSSWGRVRRPDGQLKESRCGDCRVFSGNGPGALLKVLVAEAFYPWQVDRSRFPAKVGRICDSITNYACNLYRYPHGDPAPTFTEEEMDAVDAECCRIRRCLADIEDQYWKDHGRHLMEGKTWKQAHEASLR